MSSIKSLSWPMLDVMTLACAIHRTRGFTSVSKITFFTPVGESRWTNKDILSYALVKQIAPENYNIEISVEPCDKEQAEKIIKYYRKLSFGIIAQNINDYLQNVFRITQSQEVQFKDFGVLASVPNVYENDTISKESLDQIKTTNNRHLGQEGNIVTVEVLIVETKLIDKLNCWSHVGITKDDYLISFLNKNKLLERSSLGKIRGKIKKHTKHWKTKTAETQLNYVKLIDIITN